MSTLDLNYVM